MGKGINAAVYRTAAFLEVSDFTAQSHLATASPSLYPASVKDFLPSPFSHFLNPSCCMFEKEKRKKKIPAKIQGQDLWLIPEPLKIRRNPEQLARTWIPDMDP